MSDGFNIVLLAAGKGTRLKMDIPKPLCPAGGRTLVDFVIDELNELDKEQDFYFVVGHKADEVEGHISERYAKLNPNFILQKEQLGTGHAVKTFLDNAPKASENKYTIVVCADTPLIYRQTYDQLITKIQKDDLDAVCATFKANDPTGYGRIVQAEKGFSIIEEKDASDDIRLINEVNSGLYVFKTEYLKKYINRVECAEN